MATLKAIHNGPPRRLHPEPRASASIPRAFQKRGGGEIGGGDVDGGEAAARSGRTLRSTNAVRSVPETCSVGVVWIRALVRTPLKK